MRGEFNENLFRQKIDLVYKYVNEGWAITMAEAKAGFKYANTEYAIYKRTEHYERVRKISKGVRKWN